jgi:hypothetical protein
MDELPLDRYEEREIAMTRAYYLTTNQGRTEMLKKAIGRGDRDFLRYLANRGGQPEAVRSAKERAELGL